MLATTLERLDALLVIVDAVAIVQALGEHVLDLAHDTSERDDLGGQPHLGLGLSPSEPHRWVVSDLCVKCLVVQAVCLFGVSVNGGILRLFVLEPSS